MDLLLLLLGLFLLVVGLLVLDANPLEDIRVMEDVRFVMKLGEMYKNE